MPLCRELSVHRLHGSCPARMMMTMIMMMTMMCVCLCVVVPTRFLVVKGANIGNVALFMIVSLCSVYGHNGAFTQIL